MATLASVVKKYRQSGSGVIGSLAGGINEKLKEKMDPRRLLFKRDGMLTSLFPGLKPFQAKGATEKSVSGATGELLSSGVGALQPVLESIDAYSRVSAKNSGVLPSMARDMFLVKQNIAKLVKLQGGTPQTKAGDWFNRQEARENAFELKFGKREGKKDTSPTKEKPDLGFIANILMTAVAPLVTMFESLTSTIGSVISSIAGMLGMKNLLPGGGMLGMGSKLVPLGLTVAGVAAGGAVVDWAAGKLGVGKDAEGNDIKIDQKQDDANWKKMTTWQKIQSGAARGIEKVGDAFFMDNMARQARSDRIAKETEYFNKNSPSKEGFGNFDIGDFAERVGKLESRGNYSEDNHVGFLGKYQFGSEALETYGYLKPGSSKMYGSKGPNAAVYHPDAWQKSSLQQFLNSSSEQDKLFTEYTKDHLDKLKKAGVITDASSNNEIGAALYTAHAGGVGGAIALYQKGESRNDFAYGAAGSTGASRNKMLASYEGGKPSSSGRAVATASNDNKMYDRQYAGGNTYNVDASTTNNSTGKSQGSTLPQADVIDTEFARLLSRMSV